MTDYDNDRKVGSVAGQSGNHRHGIASFVFGLVLGSYLRGHHRQTRSSAPSPLGGLSARQAMTAVAIARIVGFIVMAVFVAYYVDALALMSTP